MRLNLLLRLIFTFLLLQSVSIYAQEAQLLESNSAVELQVQRLSEELRCLVCQNQTLADSDAALAQDLKQEIREMATKGMTDQAIIDYLVARYGDFVRYRPPLNTTTAMLWLGPFTLLLAGGIGLFVMLRRRQKMKLDMPLSEDEVRQVHELLNK
jgi:cytochrome c-type biogenesis protein CcmH